MHRMLVALVTICLPVLAQAQQPATVGDLLSMGGKRLGRWDVVNLSSVEREIAGISPSGNRTFHLTYRLDGTLSGRSTALDGRAEVALAGTWWIDAQGRFCTKITDAFGNDSTPKPPCGLRFALGSALYAPVSDAPVTPVRPLSIVH